MKINRCFSALAIAIAIGSSTTTVLVPSAHAQSVDDVLSRPIPTDVDALIKHVQDVSRVAAETSDRVEGLKIELADAQGRIDAANARYEDARINADKLTAQMESSKGRVMDVSRALYNGATVSDLSAISRSSTPSEAVERTAYLASIANRNTDAIRDAENSLKQIAAARNDAALARTNAQLQEYRVKKQTAELEKQSQQLDQLTTAVKQAVDGLSPADRERWVAHNGPIDVDVSAFLARAELNDATASAHATGVVAAALSKIGSPYGWGAAGPNVFDCSGLMYWAYQSQGKTIPRTSQAQLAGGQSVSRSAIQPGDIVAYFSGASHVGMYIGDGKIVHASDYGIPVQVVPVDSMPIAGITRY